MHVCYVCVCVVCVLYVCVYACVHVWVRPSDAAQVRECKP